MQRLIYNRVHKQLLADCKNHKIPDPVDEETLLFLYLTYVQRHADNRALATRMLQETGSLFNLTQLPPYALIETFGISEIVAVGISDLGAIHVRTQMQTREKEQLNTLQKLYYHLKPYFLTGNYESTVVVCFNQRMQYLTTERCTIFDPRQTVATESLLLNIARKNFADKLVIAHNHPNISVLDLVPSAADHRVTGRVLESLAVNGVTLVEHVLVAYDGCCVLIHNEQSPFLDPDYHSNPHPAPTNLDYSTIK